MNKLFHVGVDAGSTTVKLVVRDNSGKMLFRSYRRHRSQVLDALLSMLEEASPFIEEGKLSVVVTGSAGMGISERTGIPFVQEVVASAEVVRRLYPDVKTLVDVGGEDAKIIFFDEKMRPDIRMNGNCAGGTGAFIDQMASLLDVPVETVESLARETERFHPVASRCGVFAKTDVQNLAARGVPKSEIVRSVLHAVALQFMNTLSRGRDISPKVLFSGGPLTYIPSLRDEFIEVMGIAHADMVLPDDPQLVPALGASFAPGVEAVQFSSEELRNTLMKKSEESSDENEREKPLFESETERVEWMKNRFTVAGRSVPEKGVKTFLGIDSGSTTTKMVLIDERGRILSTFYDKNNSDPMGTALRGLKEIGSSHEDMSLPSRSSVTGYGEELLKAAFDIDDGVVETVAHFMAAKAFEPEVSFILDIGGQDMKAMFIEDDHIGRIEINEACSSGCGSFIQTFAETNGATVSDFGKMALEAERPCDLGSRCTVFMNSKVKQFLREGADLSEIGAGLALSVVKNCINKVLKIRDNDLLGDHIVVQGGTFQNPSVHRALEQFLGRKVVCPDISGLMGAYGAALYAMESWGGEDTTFRGFNSVPEEKSRRNTRCAGCENRCSVTSITFANGNRFFAGNRCSRLFGSVVKGNSGYNLVERKRALLFERPIAPENPKMRIGIPRALNMFENFPFWSTLLYESGFEVVLSAPSTMDLYELGTGSIMSDSICFPAKLAHGHVVDLVKKGVDRIFYPIVVYEKNDTKGYTSFNCPIVSGYPDVIRSAVDPAGKFGIGFDSPTVNMNDNSLLKKACVEYLSALGVSKPQIKMALEKAFDAQIEFKNLLKRESAEMCERAEKEGRKTVVLVGRPYHADPLINHKVPEMLSELGLNVITGDSVTGETDANIQVLTQWAYPNRLYNAAARTVENESWELIQLNSFGCGPDAIAVDEVTAILREAGKNPTTIRIDEISSQGSIKLRLRTLVESFKLRRQTKESEARREVVHFSKEDSGRTLLVPHFSTTLDLFTLETITSLGQKVVVLPEPDDVALELGLRYTNNEICYPAILVIGSILKALKSGEYSEDDVAVAMSQTGGQCRASTYISLIRKALEDAGFRKIPVVSFTASTKQLNTQPGFRINRLDFLKKGLFGIIYIDVLTALHGSTIVREKVKGTSDRLMEKYIENALEAVRAGNFRSLLFLMEKAVDEFNAVDVRDMTPPVIGVVGEIYVKYCSYANCNVVDWIRDQGVEVYMPPLVDFFIQETFNLRYNRKSNLDKRALHSFLSRLIDRLIERYLKDVDRVMKKFRFYRKSHSIGELASRAEKILNLSNQYGEGWLIPGEIAAMTEHGIENVLSLQPFGCIANQVVSKGVEKRMRDLYPSLNILQIDLDPDTSRANLLNRLHFLVRGAFESAAGKDIRSESVESEIHG